ncbi:MAG: DNA replication/repair protein RecF [Alphaproteobacteria bacterium]
MSRGAVAARYHTEIVQSRWIQQLNLFNFRNYDTLQLNLEKSSAVLIGPNGAGKTNILEALSFLSSGKGFRKAKLGALTNLAFPEREWSVGVVLGLDQGDSIHIGTGLRADKEEEQRAIKINQTFQPQSSLAEWVTVLWQIPQMDFLFSESLSKRRRFFDKLVAAFVPEYTQHLYRYDHALRERSRLLRERMSDPQWLKILEQTISQEAMAVVSLRQSYLENLSPFCSEHFSLFPRVLVSLAGELEQWSETMPSLEVEERFQEYLKNNRAQDAITGGSSMGVHHTYVRMHHVDQNKPIEICSTGEQKALILSLVLANCRLQTNLCMRTPLLLLDEIVSHLDEKRRLSLFEEIQSLGVQAWLTGTDGDVFEPFKKHAQFFEVSDGNVLPKDV